MTLHRTLTALVLVLAAAWPLLIEAHDPKADFERALSSVRSGELSMARALLDPVLISPRIGAETRARAYYMRGLAFYLDGLWVSAGQDYRRALEFDPDFALAQNALGWLHLHGRGLTRDASLARIWYERAARNGHPEAQFNLGVLLLQGRAASPEPAGALHWFEAAAEQGHLEAMAQAGQLLARGHASPELAPDRQRAGRWLEQAASTGHIRAMLELGLLLSSGPAAAREDERAVHWLEAAAAHGSAAAQSRLGHFHLHGQGVERDTDAALMWFREAAKQGDAPAQTHLGYLYDQGIGVPADPERAYTWYRRAAERGQPTAQLNLALLYQQGRGTRLDVGAARYWFEQAAESGSETARGALAWLLATASDPALRDPERAIELAREAVAKVPDAYWFDTLAAALATSGRFDDAVSVQQQALATLDQELEAGRVSPATRLAFLGRLAQYQAGRPWLSDGTQPR